MKVAAINIYPIKSLRGLTVNSAVVEERGLQNDRRWMVADRAGKFLTQREYPRMAKISVGIGIGDDNLYVTAEGHGTLELPMEPDGGDRRNVTIWNSVCDGVFYGGVVDEWFSDVLGAACGIVYMPEDSRRSINPRFKTGSEVVSFADGYPVMVIGDASLADLNSRLDVAVPMNRFRPNIVVSGAEAFAEDSWERISIGGSVFRSTKPCERCVITTIDQSGGEVTGKEPLKTLAKFRLAKMVIPERFESLGVASNAVLFGQNLVPENIGGTLKIGDAVEIVV